LADADHYNAACVAVVAGTGQGKDAAGLGEAQRAAWRQRAVDWLRADLETCRGMLEKNPGKNAAAVASKLQHWLKDDDLSGVRGAKSLASLPEGERRGWERLWADVADTVEKARAASSKK
jgi:hypothetical protein